MKTETKISKLAIVCALCTVAVSPAISAAPVRALGGAGTYSSASSAAANKDGGNAAAARAGAVRVMPSSAKVTSGTSASGAKPAATVSSTRVASTPRLSLGKYLAANRVVSTGGSTSGGESGGVTGGDFVSISDWDKHILSYRKLEEGVGALQEQVAALDEAVDTGVSQGELDAAISEVEAKVSALETAVGSLPEDVVDSAELKAQIDEVKGLISAIENSGTVEGLQASLATLETKVDGLVSDLETRVAALELLVVDFAKTADVEASLAALQALIETKQNVGEYATAEQLKVVQDEIQAFADAEYVTASGLADVKAALQTEIANKQQAGDYVLTATLTELLAAVNKSVEARATTAQLAALKAELEERIAGVQAGGVEGLEGYVLKTTFEQALATKVDTSELSKYVLASAMDAALAAKADASELNKYVLTSAMDAALATKVSVDDLADYATLEELSAVSGFVTALQTADAGMQAAITALQDAGYVNEGTLNSKLAEYKAADEALQTAINGLAAQIPDITDLATQEAVEGLVAGLEQADANLLAAINAIQAPDVNKQYVDDAVASLNLAIEALQGVDTTVAGSITAVEQTLATLATKDELKAAKEELQAAIDGINAGNVELTNYYSKAQADAKFATIEALSGVETTAKAALPTATFDAFKETVNAEAIADAKQAGIDAATALDTYKGEMTTALDGKANSDDVYTKTEADDTFATKQDLKDNLDTLIEPGAITASMIEEGAITTDQLATDAVTTENLAAGSVTPDKISTGETTLNAGQLGMLVSDGNGGVQWVAIDVAE